MLAKASLPVTKRDASGNSGYVGSSNPGAGPCSWSHHSACDREGVGRCSPGRAWVSLPGTASSRGSWVDCLFLGHFGEQPQSEVLPPDSSRKKAVGRAHKALGAGGSSHRPDSKTNRGVNHHGIETDENIGRGMSAAEARAASKKNWVTRSEFERRSIK